MLSKFSKWRAHGEHNGEHNGERLIRSNHSICNIICILLLSNSLKILLLSGVLCQDYSQVSIRGTRRAGEHKGLKRY